VPVRSAGTHLIAIVIHHKRWSKSRRMTRPIGGRAGWVCASMGRSVPGSGGTRAIGARRVAPPASGDAGVGIESRSLDPVPVRQMWRRFVRSEPVSVLSQPAPRRPAPADDATAERGTIRVRPSPGQPPGPGRDGEPSRPPSRGPRVAHARPRRTLAHAPAAPPPMPYPEPRQLRPRARPRDSSHPCRVRAAFAAIRPASRARSDTASPHARGIE